jgi:hypothetical protein
VTVDYSAWQRRESSPPAPREEAVSAAATGQWDSLSEKDFLFPDIDPADVEHVQMTTSKGTCWVDGRPQPRKTSDGCGWPAVTFPGVLLLGLSPKLLGQCDNPGRGKAAGNPEQRAGHKKIELRIRGHFRV